jgi:glycerol transport system substrate-binding protein
VLNPKKSREYWYAQPGAPKPELPDDAPKTIQYDELIKQWKDNSAPYIKTP